MIFGGKRQWYFIRNSNIFILEKAIENVVCKMKAILFLNLICKA